MSKTLFDDITKVNISHMHATVVTTVHQIG